MSNALITLQTKIGATADGSFGPNTLKLAAKHFGLTNEQAAHFFGQCAHESGGFRLFTENLNYSADGLLKIFGKYFPNRALANQYARQPAKIASRVYANRMGNGDEVSGDGWKYRGRGAIQLTGKDNYQQFASGIGAPSILSDPDQVADAWAFESAKFFFDKNGLWSLCGTVDDASITKVTRRVNGGTHGLKERQSLTKRYYSWLTS